MAATNDDAGNLADRAGQALRAGKPERAAEIAQQLLQSATTAAGQAEGYLLLGRALNNLRRLDEAADAFSHATDLAPGSAESHDMLGHVLRSLGRLDEAIASFETARQLDPKLVSAWRNLGVCCSMAGRPEQALECFTTVLRLDPGDAATHINLGLTCHTLRQYDDAIRAYRAALAIDGNNATAHMNLGLVFAEARRTDEAEVCFREALRLQPDYPDALAELAAIYDETNRLDDMQVAVQRGLQMAPAHPRLNLEAAKHDRRSGNFDSGIRRLTQLDLAALPPRTAWQIHYELGNLYDRAAQPNEAFEQFAAGNELARQSWRARNVSGERYLAKLDALYAFFTDADAASWPPAPPMQESTPAFLIGFPRSGTTLVDVILDSHPEVQTLEEKPTINLVEQAVARLDGGYPGALATLDAAGIESLRDLYFRTVDQFIERRPGALLVDKLHIRTTHTGLIWRLFPDARLLFTLRHPCDVILSNFMQQYVMNDAFANFFTLADAVTIYDKVMRLWALYCERLPINYFMSKYEDLVADPELQARRMVGFLGLEWRDEVMDYRRRAIERGRINTNSYHQVTEPIYQRSRYRWLRYRDRFEPFLDRLRPHLERYGYPD